MGEEEKMKSMIVAVIATVGMTVAGTAAAQADLAQKNCGSCHALDAKKMGPSFKDIAKKFKGNATAQADLVAKIGSGKGHPAVKASPDDLNNIMKWVLAQ
jgi:cytochrome c